MSKKNLTQNKETPKENSVVSHELKVLSVGMDKDLLKEGSESFKRHQEYAKHFKEMHSVVFARGDAWKEKVSIAENAWSYPTKSQNTLMLFYDAYLLGRTILRSEGEWVISVQDPFESGFVGYLLAKMTGTPLLIQEHGDFFSAPYWRRESFKNKLRYFVGLYIVRQADCVRVVSARIQKTLVHIGVKEENIHIAPVYTDVAVFAQALPDKELLALKEQGEVLILSMARFVPQKNLSLLIGAFIKAFQKGMLAKLVLIGKGEEEEKLKQLAKRAPKGSVVFKNWTENPAGAMKSADIYALSSNYEGWGRVCIEALAGGVPLIMTDVGCASEVVVDGENGLVVPVGDEWALAEGLYCLAKKERLREQLRARGRSTVESLGSFPETAQRYIQSVVICKKKQKSKK